MKGTGLLLMAVTVALVAIMVPLMSQKACAADVGYIERLVPAESQEVETGGGVTPLMPVKFEKLTGVPGICSAETAEVEIGGTPWPAHIEKVDAAGRIERLCPVE